MLTQWIALQSFAKPIKTAIQAFLKEEDGLSATEYVVLFIVVLAFIIVGASLLGPQIVAAFQRAADALP